MHQKNYYDTVGMTTTTMLADGNPRPERFSYGSILGGVLGVVFLVVTSIILASVTVCCIKTKNEGIN